MKNTNRKVFSQCCLMTVALTMVLLRTAQGQVVNAADYGWNAEDATEALQKAIDSKAEKVVVPDMGSPWIVRPIFLRSDNQEIVFEPGVVILAKKGEFHGSDADNEFGYDDLFTLEGNHDITLRGYGATFRMRKEDYQNPDLYAHSEHRHCLYIHAAEGKPVENIKVLGLRLESSGGDGLYIGGKATPGTGLPHWPKNVWVQDVICDDNHRQGMSITAAENLTITDCVMQNTVGTPPQAGIDFEPDWNPLRNVNMINCVTVANKVKGIDVYLFRPPVQGSTEVDISISHCHSSTLPGSSRQGLGGNVGGIFDEGISNTPLQGSVRFDNCTFYRKESFHALQIVDKSALYVDLDFNNCIFTQEDGGVPINFLVRGNTNVSGSGKKNPKLTYGGVNFSDCVINFDRDAPFAQFSNESPIKTGIQDIGGNLTVNNPYQAGTALGNDTQNITWAIKHQATRAPVVEFASPSHLQTVAAGSVFTAEVTAYDPDISEDNGAGIDSVKFTLRRGEQIVRAATENLVPYTFFAEARSLEGGIYTLRADAFSTEYGSVGTNTTVFVVDDWTDAQTTSDSTPVEVIVRAQGETGEEQIVLLANGVPQGEAVTLSTMMADYAWTVDAPSAELGVQFVNDGRNATDADKNVRVDYVVVAGDTLQAEAQPTNTGNWSFAGGCGTVGSSEWLYCNGYIAFEVSPPEAPMITSSLKGDSTSSLRSENVGLRVYPNPSRGQVRIRLFSEFSSNKTDWRLTDVSGRPVRSGSSQAAQWSLSTEGLVPGPYLVEVRQQHRQWTERLLVE